MEELKDCPYCGESEFSVEMFVILFDSGEWGKEEHVRCSNCFAMGPDPAQSAIDVTAIQEWNSIRKGK